MQTLCQKHLAHAVHLLRMQIVCLRVGVCSYLALCGIRLDASVSKNGPEVKDTRVFNVLHVRAAHFAMQYFNAKEVFASK